MAEAVEENKKALIVRLRADLSEARDTIKALRHVTRILRLGPLDVDRIRELLEGGPNYLPSSRSQVTAERIVKDLNAAKALPRDLLLKVGSRS